VPSSPPRHQRADRPHRQLTHAHREVHDAFTYAARVAIAPPV